jgi:hypothetical protein
VIKKGVTAHEYINSLVWKDKKKRPSDKGQPLGFGLQQKLLLPAWILNNILVLIDLTLRDRPKLITSVGINACLSSRL